jgi:hypothetical protein
MQDDDARGEYGDVAERVERVGDAQRDPGQHAKPGHRGHGEDREPADHPRRGDCREHERSARVMRPRGGCLHAVLEH